jgi:gamma-glutamylcyclotransferase (GGCT)/AIG2-like uncharacterized protein YtfP
MIEKLFVYGTLAPGQPNEHLLSGIGGRWEPTTLKGHLHQVVGGPGIVYPAIVPDEKGKEVRGYIFSSPRLHKHWDRLDAFEGREYSRVLAKVRTKKNQSIEVHVYALRQ